MFADPFELSSYQYPVIDSHYLIGANIATGYDRDDILQ